MKTPLEYFLHWVEVQPDAPFLRQPYGDSWIVLSYAQASAEAGRIAAALHHEGLKRGDHIAIYSKNCMHWVLADLAIAASDDAAAADIGFRWNAATSSYELVTDLDLWRRPVPVERFLAQITQRYALRSILAASAEEG